MNKQFLIMRDIVCKHHPKFRNRPDRKKLALECPEMFNVEFLVEECLAALGPYDYTDGYHADFSDDSDSKTSSIGTNTYGKRRYVGFITNVISKNLKTTKTGALRCVIYNPHKQNLRYYFLPKDAWSNLSLSKYNRSIRFSYDVYTDSIPKFDAYQCKSFKELALAT